VAYSQEESERVVLCICLLRWLSVDLVVGPDSMGHLLVRLVADDVLVGHLFAVAISWVGLVVVVGFLWMKWLRWSHMAHCVIRIKRSFICAFASVLLGLVPNRRSWSVIGSLRRFSMCDQAAFAV
jgi:hypothetical protein